MPFHLSICTCTRLIGSAWLACHFLSFVYLCFEDHNQESRGDVLKTLDPVSPDGGSGFSGSTPWSRFVSLVDLVLPAWLAGRTHRFLAWLPTSLYACDVIYISCMVVYVSSHA